MPNKHFCQGPWCHTQVTQDRFLKSRGVIRGRYARLNRDYDTSNSYYGMRDKYFCSQGCQNDFWRIHGNAIRQIAPRHEPLETPCEVRTETREGWNGTYTYKTVDKLSNVG